MTGFQKGDKVLITKKFNNDAERKSWISSMDNTVGKIGIIDSVKETAHIFGESFNYYNVRMPETGYWSYHEGSLSKANPEIRANTLKLIKSKK